MAAPKHFNTTHGSVPYKNLFHTVSVVPAGSSLAYISTQWACDPKTGELMAGTEGDYFKQSAAVWANVVGILKELGVGFEAVVHRTVNFADFNEGIGVEVITAMMGNVPPEWHGLVFSSALTFRGGATFHLPGIVYAVELVVAVPALQ